MNVGRYESGAWCEAVKKLLAVACLCGLPFVGLAEEDKPFFGISVMTPSTTLRHHRELKPGQGLVVASVHPGSPAEAAGLKRHDVLLEVEGKSLGSEQQLIELMDTFKVDQKVTCWVIQKGKHDVVEVTFGKRPAGGKSSFTVGNNPNMIVLDFPQAAGGNLQPGKGHSMRTMMVHDGVFAIEAREVNGKLTLVVRGTAGPRAEAAEKEEYAAQEAEGSRQAEEGQVGNGNGTFHPVNAG